MVLRGSLTPRGNKKTGGRSFDEDDLCQAFQVKVKVKVTPSRNPKRSPSNTKNKKAPEMTPKARGRSKKADSVKEDLRLAFGSEPRCMSKKAARAKGKTAKKEDGKKAPAASSVARATRSRSRGRRCA